MSVSFAPLVSKIRCHNPNRKGAAKANRNSLHYIGTREGVDLNIASNREEMMEIDASSDTVAAKGTTNVENLKYISNRPRSHGLFGNIDTEDLKTIEEKVEALTREGRNIYRGIVSLGEQDAMALGYTDSKQWENYLTLVMPNIAKELGVNPADYTWVAAFHAEQHHPHVHFHLWDNQDRVKSSYIHVSKQEKCREIFSQAMFTPEHEALVKELTAAEREEYVRIKNDARKEITDEIKKWFTEPVTEYIPGTTPENMPKGLEHEEMGVLTREIKRLIEILPGAGSFKYKYMPPEVKRQIDSISKTLLSRADMKKNLHSYLQCTADLQRLVGATEKEISEAVKKAESEVLSRSGNIVLSATKRIGMGELDINVLDINFPIEDFQEMGVASEGFEFGQDWSASEFVWADNNEYIDQFFNEDTPELDAPNEEAVEVEADHKAELIIESGSSIEKIDFLSDPVDEEYSVPEEVEEQAANDEEKEKTINTIRNFRPDKFHLSWTKQYKEALKNLYETKDFERARNLLIGEAQNGNTLALHDLAKIYERGIGIPADPDIAEAYYGKALEGFLEIEKTKSRAYTEYRIAKLYESGKGTEMDYKKAISWYKEAVAQDHKYAQYSLAKMYIDLKEVPADQIEEYIEKAGQLLRRSAEQGNAYASFELGKLYESGKVLEQEDHNAGVYYEKAFHGFSAMLEERQDDNVLYRLGRMYKEGKGTEINTTAALECFEKASELGNVYASFEVVKHCMANDDLLRGLEILQNLEAQGNEQAMYQLAKLHLDEASTVYDPEKGLKYCLKSAEAGNLFAQCLAGKNHLKGIKGVIEADVLKAMEYYETAAQKGSNQAMYQLAKLYLDEAGTVYDPEKGWSYCQGAAAAANPYAQLLMVKIYLKGLDGVVEIDVEKAIEILETLTAQGNDQAMYQLAKIYLDPLRPEYSPEKGWKSLLQATDAGNKYALLMAAGIYAKGLPGIVEKDPARAAEILKDLAAGGSDQAMYQLANLYLDEESALYSPEKGLKHLQQAAEIGNQFAQLKLGNILLYGKHGVEKDEEKGLLWLQKAEEQGNEYAKQSLAFYSDKGNSIAYSMFRGIFSMLLMSGGQAQSRYQQKEFSSKSKQARKEAYLKNRIKGMEVE